MIDLVLLHLENYFVRWPGLRIFTVDIIMNEEYDLVENEVNENRKMINPKWIKIGLQKATFIYKLT